MAADRCRVRDENLDRAESVDWHGKIDMSRQRLFVLPRRLLPFRRCSDVESFSLADNYISNIPRSFVTLYPLLRVLDLHGNLLQFIPEGLQYLLQLQELNLSSNKLRWLSQTSACNSDGQCGSATTTTTTATLGTLSRMRMLRVLLLGKNRIEGEELAFVHSLPGLEVLDLCNNDIRAIPASFLFNCRKLSRLYLGGNPISTIPKTLLANLSSTSLTELYLQGMGLQVLPAVICKLKHLKIIDASCNELSILPPSFSQLMSLEHLCLDTNCFPNIPESVFSLGALKSLSLSQQDDLQHLSARLSSLPLLESLQMNSCALRWIPSGILMMPALKKLSMRSNRVHALPFCCTLNYDLRLDLEGNPLRIPLPCSLDYGHALAKDFYLDAELQHCPAHVTVVLTGDTRCCQRLFTEMSKSEVAGVGKPVSQDVTQAAQCCSLLLDSLPHGNETQSPVSGLQRTLQVYLVKERYDWAANVLTTDSTIVIHCVDIESANNVKSRGHIKRAVLDECSSVSDVVLFGITRSASTSDLSTKQDWISLVAAIEKALDVGHQGEVQKWHRLGDELNCCHPNSEQWESCAADLITHEIGLARVRRVSRCAVKMDSATDDLDISPLLDVLNQVLSSGSDFPELVPKSWGVLRKALQNQQVPSPVLPISHARAIAGSLGIGDNNDLSDVLDYFHRAGVAIVTSFLPLEALEDEYIILDMAWLMSVLHLFFEAVSADSVSPLDMSRSLQHICRQCGDIQQDTAEVLLAIGAHFGVVRPEVATCQLVHGLPPSLHSGNLDGLLWLATVPEDQTELTVVICLTEENLLLEDLVATCATQAQVRFSKTSDGYYFLLATFWHLMIRRNGGVVSIQLRSPVGICSSSWRVMNWILVQCQDALLDYSQALLEWPCPHCVRLDGMTSLSNVPVISRGRSTLPGNVEIMSCPRSNAILHTHMVYPPDGLGDSSGLALSRVLSRAHDDALTALSQSTLCPCVQVMCSLQQLPAHHTSRSGDTSESCNSSSTGNGLVVNAGNNSTVVVLENATIVVDNSSASDRELLPGLSWQGHSPLSNSESVDEPTMAIAPASVSDHPETNHSEETRSEESSDLFSDISFSEVIRNVACSYGCDVKLLRRVLQCVACGEWSVEDRQAVQELARIVELAKGRSAGDACGHRDVVSREESFESGPSAEIEHDAVESGPSAEIEHDAVESGPSAEIEHDAVESGPSAEIEHDEIEHDEIEHDEIEHDEIEHDAVESTEGGSWGIVHPPRVTTASLSQRMVQLSPGADCVRALLPESIPDSIAASIVATICSQVQGEVPGTPSSSPL